MQRTFYYFGFLFILGGVSYCLLELLWRGYTDITMGIAGGVSLCLLSLIQKHLKQLKFFYRCILGGLSITIIELIFGVVFNLYLNRAVWDYSLMPFNLLGQICLSYTALWCLLSAPMLIATELIMKKVRRNNPVSPQNL